MGALMSIGETSRQRSRMAPLLGATTAVSRSEDADLLALGAELELGAETESLAANYCFLSKNSMSCGSSGQLLRCEMQLSCCRLLDVAASMCRGSEEMALTFTIHSSKDGNVQQTLRIGSRAAVDRALALRDAGWDVYITDAAGRQYQPETFETLAARGPALPIQIR